MERPTSALHLTRVTLSLRQLGAEPHTKEVGRDAVYNYHRFRSARCDDGGRCLVTEPAHAGTAVDDLGHGHDYAVRGAAAWTRPGALLLRSGRPCGFELQRALTVHE